MSKRKGSDADIAFAIAGFALLWGLAGPGGLRTSLGLAVTVLLVAAATVMVAMFLRRLVRSAAARVVQPAERRRIEPTLFPEMSRQPAECDSSSDWQRDQRTALSGPLEWSSRLIESLEWKRFEELCGEYFKAKGYKVTMTGLGADNGVDFFLHGDEKSTQPLGVAQCKAWGSRQVGVKPIRELLGVMIDAGCPLGIFITTSSYTAEAERFAAGKHIKLLDGRRLLSLIKTLPETAQAGIFARVTEGDYTTPSCPTCGIKLVLRTATKGEGKGRQFWGCQNFPTTCRYSMPAGSDPTVD